MYYSFVFPYLIYCVRYIREALKSYLDPLVKIQKKYIRTISFSEYLAPSEPLFLKLNILNFEKLVIRRISLMMFKCNIGVLPLPVSGFFFNIILLIILIILEEVNLSTHLLVGVKLLIELSLTVVHIFGIISLKMFPQMFHTPVLKI